MEGREREEESSLPPDYVSLAQLQERWLKKQQEKKLKEKQEEERENGGHGNIGGGSARDGVGRKDGVIEGKGKGKEIVIGGFENGEENEKKHMKKKKRSKNRRFGKMKSRVDERKGKEMDKEKVGIEMEQLDGGEIVDGELNGNKEIASVCVVEVLPRNGEKGEIADAKRRDFGGGFGKNGDNGGSFYKCKKEYAGRFNRLKQNDGKKMEDEKGYGKKWRERGRNGDYQESRADVLKGNQGEFETEKKAEDEIFEGFSEKCGLSGRDRGGDKGRSEAEEDGVEGEGSSYYWMALEKKVDDEVSVVESAKNRKKGGVGKGYRKYGNWKGNFGDGRRDTRSRRLEELETEKKAEDEILEGFSEKCGLSGRDRDGDKGRCKAEKDEVEGEGSSDDRMAMEKKVDDEVLVVDSAKNGRKGGIGKGYRRYGKWKGDFGERRSDTRSRRFEDCLKMKQRERVKMWVKKEEKPGADAAEVGSSGVSVDQE